MSEEQKETSTQLVNNELTERVNNAYIGDKCNLLRGSDESWVMMECKKDDKSVDVLFALDSMEEMVDGLKKELTNG